VPAVSPTSELSKGLDVPAAFGSRSPHGVSEISAADSVSRRTVLRLGAITIAAGVLAACGGSPVVTSDPATEPGGALDPDRVLRTDAGLAEGALTDLYAGAAPAFSTDVAARILDLGARHVVYRAAIDPSNLGATQATPGSTTLRPSATSTPATRPPTAPTTPKAAIDQLLAAETDAATSLTAQAVRAKDPELARILVLAAAGAAAAGEVLRRERT